MSEGTPERAISTTRNSTSVETVCPTSDQYPWPPEAMPIPTAPPRRVLDTSATAITLKRNVRCSNATGTTDSAFNSTLTDSTWSTDRSGGE